MGTQERTTHPDVNVAALIIDYVSICERRNERLDLGDFIDLWCAADEIAVGSTPGGVRPRGGMHSLRFVAPQETHRKRGRG